MTRAVEYENALLVAAKALQPFTIGELSDFRN
jgi:hypothetical protein